MKKSVFAFCILLTIVSYSFSQSVIVNPDGTHSIGINHGSTTTVIHSNGTHSIAHKHGNTIVVVNPDGTHSIGIDHHHDLFDDDKKISFSKDSKKEEDFITMDSLFSLESRNFEQEMFKLQVLREDYILKGKEFKLLKKQLKIEKNDIPKYISNQIYDLHCRLKLKEISKIDFRNKKEQIIATFLNE